MRLPKYRKPENREGRIMSRRGLIRSVKRKNTKPRLRQPKTKAW